VHEILARPSPGRRYHGFHRHPEPSLPVVYYIVPNGQIWRVQSRGFTWEFPTGQQAAEFAVEMADRYAGASGRTTCVRMQTPDGEFHELRRFAGVALHPGALSLRAGRGPRSA
jgi:hypothetical protein